MNYTTENQTNTIMSTAADRSKAAAILGALGGRAGTGAAKRRSPEVIAKAVRNRIAANKKRKRLRLKAEAEAAKAAKAAEKNK